MTKLIPYLKLIIPVLLLVYLFRSHAKLSGVIHVIKTCHIVYFIFGISLFLIAKFQMAIRLVILSSDYFSVRYFPILKDIFIANFFNTFLLTGSGEVYRVKGLAKVSGEWIRSTALITLDRLFGFSSVLTFGVIALIFRASHFKMDDSKMMLFIIGILVLAFLISGLILKKKKSKPKIIMKTEVLFTFIHDHPFKALILYLYSIIIMTTFISAIFIVAKSLYINFEFMDFLLLYPFVLIVSLAPVSIGGLGVRELAMVRIFGVMGVSSEQCISLGLMQYGLMLVVSMIGMYLFFRTEG